LNTSAAITTRPSAQSAPTPYSSRNSESSSFGSPLSVVKRSFSNCVGSSWCQMVKAKIDAPTTSRTQSLVRRR
jgi:hypothetical protein